MNKCSSTNLVDFYNKVFSEDSWGSWDDAPGKDVFVNAMGYYLQKRCIPEKAKIVEIGCGTGRLLNRIRKEVESNDFTLCGVDFSEAAVSLCKQANSSIKAYCEDGSNTHFHNDEFDVALSYGAYEHFPVPSKAILELARILKPGGVFFCMLPTLGIYRTDRTDEGWYTDLSVGEGNPEQMQWNLVRRTWETYFREANLKLYPVEDAEQFGAKKAGVFYFGEKTKIERCTKQRSS